MGNTIQISVQDTQGVVRSYYKTAKPLAACDEEARVMLMVNGIRTGPGDDDIEMLDIYYQEKLTRLRWIFEQIMEPQAIFRMPLWDDMIWVRFRDPVHIESLTPLFDELGMFESDRDCLSGFTKPLAAVGLNFRITTITVFKLMFFLCSERTHLLAAMRNLNTGDLKDLRND